ncbi:MAG TPA: FMN-binding negative transcriptional regulator [Mycobacteriales bacterium]|nr:FMN-binding negative transcriptional regulator [Mycobacteriales bacterium]
MLIHPWDTARDDAQWREFAERTGFGHLVAAGRGRDLPVIVPTQFVFDGDDLLIHLARPNPVWQAIEENDRVVFTVSGDWAYIPSAWKAIGDEDPALGIPTTYYASVQFVAKAAIVDDPEQKLQLLRRQLAVVEPTGGHADPAVHRRQLNGIRGLRLTVEDVRAKFKYGGNVDAAHRESVADHLHARGDIAVETQVRKGLEP